MPSNINRDNKSNSKTNLGCLCFVSLPLLYLQVIYPFIEVANGCPNGGPKSATLRSIARPAFDCTTYGKAYIVGLVTGICVSAYLIYTRIRKGQRLKLDNRSSTTTKKQRPNFWAVVFVVGGTAFFFEPDFWNWVFNFKRNWNFSRNHTDRLDGGAYIRRTRSSSNRIICLGKNKLKIEETNSRIVNSTAQIMEILTY